MRKAPNLTAKKNQNRMRLNFRRQLANWWLIPEARTTGRARHRLRRLHSCAQWDQPRNVFRDDNLNPASSSRILGKRVSGRTRNTPE